MREQKPIDPALRRYLDEQAAAAQPCADEAEQIRAGRDVMPRALASRASIPGLPNAVTTREVVPGSDSQWLARLYQPHAEPSALLVYFHGGGWVFGSVATHDPFCRLLAAAAGVRILSIEYRLAPEAPYPAAAEDALSAVRWASAHATELGATPTLLAGGDSAGANLAAVAAHTLLGAEEPVALAGLLLLYPVADHPDAAHASWTENATGYGLEAARMRWFWEKYAPGIAPDEPQVAPLRHPALPAWPPTFVATAEYDVLRDEGLAYAARLEGEGVALTHVHAPDMHHNFPVHPGTVARFPQSNVALGQAAGWLRAVVAAAAATIRVQPHSPAA